jgi:D-alanyl-D-alanine carboxypeptidase/D-alanyl-D-alanine-endopeptidase (penicillin-binding protein 4)
MRCGAASFLPAFFTASIFCTAATDLEHRIDSLVDATGPATRGFVGINVVDAATGKPVYHRNEDKLFMPASNMKLFTSALALSRLGPDYRFTTNVIVNSSGDLMLLGSGDPSLSGRIFPYAKDSGSRPGLAAIDELADQIVKNGVRTIAGDVIGDDRLYPWAPYPPSWTQDDAERDYGAPVSALSISENAISLTIRGGAQPGDDAQVSPDPALEYFSIDNRLNTITRGGETKIRMARSSASRQVLLWGSIPAGATVREWIALDDPAYYAACALYEALLRRGVSIRGGPSVRHRLVSEDYEVPIGNLVASRTSPALKDLLQVMDKVSQNLFAELMLREVGRFSRHQGTREAGIEEMDAMLKEIGASRDEARLEDGSGLSRGTLVTPKAAARLSPRNAAPRYAAFAAAGGRRRRDALAPPVLHVRSKRNPGQNRIAQPRPSLIGIRRQQDPWTARVLHPGERFFGAAKRSARLD